MGRYQDKLFLFSTFFYYVAFYKTKKRNKVFEKTWWQSRDTRPNLHVLLFLLLLPTTQSRPHINPQPVFHFIKFFREKKEKKKRTRDKKRKNNRSLGKFVEGNTNGSMSSEKSKSTTTTTTNLTMGSVVELRGGNNDDGRAI